MKQNNGIKLKMWEYFCIFAVLLLVVIWTVQIALLQFFYVRDMTNQSLSDAREIVELYSKNKLNEEKVRSKAFKNNMSIIITDADGDVISATNAMGEMDPKSLDILFERYQQNISEMNEKISARQDSYVELVNKQNKRREMFFAAFCEEGVEHGGTYFYIISQINPIDSVTMVLQRQFIYTTVISLVLALVFSYFIARRFSRPIEKLTVSAKELALGNNKADFTVPEAFGEIEELSSALEYASSEINRSAELRQELMANVSHDLRTPLTMIKMYAEMIRDISGDNPEKRNKNLKVIIDETDRLSMLVNDILDLSRLEKSNELDFKSFDLCAVAKTIIERFAIMEEYSIILDAPDSLVVTADFEKIQQVLYNLIGNAVNYTGEDKKVEVKITRRNNFAHVEITDTGEGIGQDELPLVWDRYYRSKTHLRSKIGTGLGLSIVKSILVLHGVDFGIKSTLGVGSTFWFDLKLSKTGEDKIIQLGN